MKEPHYSYWSISLDAECPHCNLDVNLLDYVDFWDGVSFTPIEHGTNRTTEIEVMCPECGEMFETTLAY